MRNNNQNEASRWFEQAEHDLRSGRKPAKRKFSAERSEQNGQPKGDFSRMLASSLNKPPKRRSKLYVMGAGKEMLLDIQIAI